MAYGYAISIVPEVQRSLAFGSISGTYAALGTPLLYPARFITIQNDTDADMQISEDGVNPHYIIPAKSGYVRDFAANQTHTQGGFKAAGTQFWVKQLSGAPSLSAIYLSSEYGLNG